MFLLSVILIGVSALLYLWWFYKRAYDYFARQGVPCAKNTFIFGSVPEFILQTAPVQLVHLRLYRELEPHPFGGVFTFHMPSFLIRDPELIKNVMVKDFDSFQNHGMKVHKEVEPMANSLFNMEDEEWKNLRIKLTCTFTTGKMKMMFPLMKDCAIRMTKVLDNYASRSEEFEARDICSRYTIASIGSCAFGIETDTIENPNSEFGEYVQQIFKMRMRVLLRLVFPNIPGSLIKFFKLQWQAENVTSYFRDIVDKTVDYREKNKVTRNDFLDLLISLKNNTELTKLKSQNDTEDLNRFLEQIGEKYVKSDVEMTIDLMAAQCFLFFGAGFEGASSTLMFLLYELSLQPDIQSKARNEMKEVLEEYDGEVTYDSLKKMVYTDMLIAETLRKYPLAVALMRKCNRAYKIPNSNTIIPEGKAVLIPIYGLHFDKKYYEKPDEFYPEHFTAEAKANRPNYTYLPFGDGPRVCIAERFAKMQIKVGLIYLLLNYEYRLAARTKIPFEYMITTAINRVKGGIWVKCKKISDL